MTPPPLRHVLMTADTIGGVWTYALDLAAELGRSGVRVTLMTMGRMPDTQQRKQAASHANISLVPTDFRLEWMPGCERDLHDSGEFLLRLARNLRPDVVHLNTYWHAALPFQAPAVLVAHSCVASWWQHCRQSQLPAEWNSYCGRVAEAVRAADMVIAPSGAYLQEFETLHGAAGASRVVWNGRDAHLFRPGAKTLFALAAGRLWDEAKNIQTVCRAADGAGMPVAVAGDAAGPDGNIAQFENVSVLGRLGPAELAQAMARASVFIAPARYEPFGLTVLEAALSGCALVLGDIPTLRELWHGAADFVDPDDADGLRRRLTLLARQPERLARNGRRARQRAQTYSLTRMGAAYCDAYRAVLQRRSSAFEAVA